MLRSKTYMLNFVPKVLTALTTLRSYRYVQDIVLNLKLLIEIRVCALDLKISLCLYKLFTIINYWQKILHIKFWAVSYVTVILSCLSRTCKKCKLKKVEFNLKDTNSNDKMFYTKWEVSSEQRINEKTKKPITVKITAKKKFHVR